MHIGRIMKWMIASKRGHSGGGGNAADLQSRPRAVSAVRICRRPARLQPLRLDGLPELLAEYEPV